MKVRFLIVLFLLASKWIWGQAYDPVMRLELPIEYEGDRFYNIPCDTAGFLLVYNPQTTKSGEYLWKIKRYDSYFQQQDSAFVAADINLTLSQWLYRDGFVFFIFYSPKKRKELANNIQIVRYELSTGKSVILYANIPYGGKIEHLEGNGNEMFFSLQKSNHKTFLFYADFSQNNVYQINTDKIEDENTEIESMVWDPVSGRLFLAFNIYHSKSVQYLRLFSIPHSKMMTKLIDINANEHKKFNDAKMAFSKEHKLMIFGTFDIYTSKTISKADYYNNNTTGFYSMSIQSLSKQPKIHYYNFLEFKNVSGNSKSTSFFKKKKKLEKQKEVSLEYNVLLHNIRFIDDRIYFVAEAYYAQYHNETSFYYDYYNRSRPITTTVFDGYNFFNAFIGCFDQEGVMLWDNSFEIYNILTLEKEKRIVSFKQNEAVVFAYNYQHEIVSKVFDTKGNTLSGVRKIKLESKLDGDKVMDESDSGMHFWYDNYFLAYGRQLIVNNNRPNSRRYVYYVNLLAFGKKDTSSD